MRSSTNKTDDTDRLTIHRYRVRWVVTPGERLERQAQDGGTKVRLWNIGSSPACTVQLSGSRCRAKMIWNQGFRESPQEFVPFVKPGEFIEVSISGISNQLDAGINVIWTDPNGGELNDKSSGDYERVNSDGCVEHEQVVTFLSPSHCSLPLEYFKNKQ